MPSWTKVSPLANSSPTTNKVREEMREKFEATKSKMSYEK